MGPAWVAVAQAGRHRTPNDTMTGIRRTLAGLRLAIGNLPLVLNRSTTAATGNSQATSALIESVVNDITAADGTKGVRLPIVAAGTIMFVYNSVATNGLPIYPGTSGTINGGSANAAITIEGKTLAVLVSTDGTNWAAIFTANT